ncbi:MAG: acyl-CoA thioesterase-1 [Desulforhopalus sp.]|jgi:acyl-CoA thioesterase-1
MKGTKMKRLACMGDSLTEGADLVTGHTWPSLVGNALTLNVSNFGIGGDTTQGMLSRFYPEVIQCKPDYVFIMGGTNDLWWDWEVKTIMGNIFSMCFQARYHNITPIIGLPMPVVVESAQKADFSPPLQGYERLVEMLPDLVNTLNTYATDSEIPVVDLHQPFLINDQKADSTLFLDDGLHPNQRGHQLIADNIIKSFRELFRF